MPDITIPDELARKLEALAAREKSTIADFLSNVVEDYFPVPAHAPETILSYKTIASVLHIAADALIITDAQQRIQIFNESAEKVFGYTVDAVRGQPLAMLLPDINIDVHDFPVQNSAESIGQIRRMEKGNQVYGTRADGTVFTVEATITKIREGDNLYFVALLRDMSEYETISHQLQEYIAWLHLIAENIADVVCLHQPNGKYLYITPSCEKTVGYTAEEFLHANAYDFFHPDDMVAIQDSYHTSLTGVEVENLNYRFRVKSGGYIWLETSIKPILNEAHEVEYLLTVSRDVTQRKLAQDELESALERERELNRMKSNFLSVVSHEFRTPMTIISTSTDLARHYLGTNPDNVLKRLDKIDAQIRRLDNIMKNVNIINNPENAAKNITYTPIDLRAFFVQLTTDLKTAFNDAVPIRVEHPEYNQLVYLDENLLYHIFINLLSNAIKYSPDGGEVTLSYACTENLLYASVSDKGIGIPEADHTKLFGIFQRGRNVGAISGTGLGLVVVKQCLTMLNGGINFKSQEGTGTTFYVDIPFQLEPVANFR
jgi:PAS domain S-box-containing protein